ncbi:diacylglycerol kinase [Polynucleobacter sp. AM-26B4]|uniref:diacylglycerol kinase n=1 Tax=Polynucleobacter sp. AM-26B4 TaxID=2689103 RepID=UPI0021046D9B|nr:diacylglycerol kinase [Polynucleobacter sp. AM-26B4]
MKKYKIEDNPHKGNKGITRAFRAAINSWNGLIYAFNEESAFRQELGMSLVLIPLAIYLPVTPIEKILLIASVILVLIIELLNSSVEAAIDRISFEVHDLSKRAKDFGSAAVMLALLLCGLTWVIILSGHYL